MSDTPTINPLNGSFGFTRKVQVRPYETAEAFINIQFEIPTDPALSVEERVDILLANARAAATQAKGLVFEELGLEFSVGEDGVVRELVEKNFGNVTEVVATSPSAAPALQAVPSSNVAATPPHPVDDSGRPVSGDKEEGKANQAWAKERFYGNPSEFYDNRPKKASGDYKSTAPDVKHKTTKIGVWL